MRKKFVVGLLIIICTGILLYPACAQKQKSSKQDLSSWIGTYTFSEFYEPNINLHYELSIVQDDNGYYGTLTADGFQMLIRARLITKGNQNRISLIMDEYLPENVHELYHKGELLFSLINSEGNIQTEWGAITPLLLENNVIGKIGFKKNNPNP